MKQLSCPVCGTTPQVDEISHFDLVSCANCSLVWTGITEPVDAEKLYSDEVYQVVDNRGSIFEKIILREAAAVLSCAESLNPGGGRRLLDFGCGKGQFLRRGKDLGWSAVGVETSPERANFARIHYGVEVFEEYYEQGVIGSGDFDLITLNHVLEHLPAPITLVGDLLESNLAAGGIAMIEVPRLDSLQSRIAGRDWMHLDIPKHLSHWTEAKLTSVLSGLGYEVVARRRFSIHLGVLGMLQALGTRVGYKDNIIVGLKRKRSAKLLLLVAVLTPVAFLLESVATLFNRSGVFGLFVQNNKSMR